MSTTKQPASKPTATKDVSVTAPRKDNNRREFLAAAGTMSWQLAIVVLVPLLLGSQLDKHFHTAPIWTLFGFVLAMAGTAGVMWQQLRRLTPPPVDGGKK